MLVCRRAGVRQTGHHASLSHLDFERLIPRPHVDATTHFSFLYQAADRCEVLHIFDLETPNLRLQRAAVWQAWAGTRGGQLVGLRGIPIDLW